MFSQTKLIENISKKEYDVSNEEDKRDFYNLITGEVVCGKCGKKFKSLFLHFFHWHLIR